MEYLESRIENHILLNTESKEAYGVYIGSYDYETSDRLVVVCDTESKANNIVYSSNAYLKQFNNFCQAVHTLSQAWIEKNPAPQRLPYPAKPKWKEGLGDKQITPKMRAEREAWQKGLEENAEEYGQRYAIWDAIHNDYLQKQIEEDMLTEFTLYDYYNLKSGNCKEYFYEKVNLIKEN